MRKVGKKSQPKPILPPLPKDGKGIKRTPQHVGDPAAKVKTQEYVVGSIDSLSKQRSYYGISEDHFLVTWGGEWDQAYNRTWEPARHLPGHEARMKELTDARDLQLEQEEHKLNARAAAVQEKRKRTTRDGKHLFSTTSLSRPGSGN